ncbi:MAG TPA: DUF2892 domain-containing protein [Nitrospinota bacterium]|jgi:hypothetical protein|nr:DUF2892 domain-containing protein [Nitrospinota bacterium]|tara:strand:+ start:1751 stop:1942 length:192 start_codon:yes stop_codon:yes gene_type:complete
MKTNIGTVERVVRVIAGIGILSLIFVGPQSLWGLTGIIPLATGFVGYCPACHFGFSTCKKYVS